MFRTYATHGKRYPEEIKKRSELIKTQVYQDKRFRNRDINYLEA